MNNNGELKDTTKDFIIDGNVNPGVYYENPKTHKFGENIDLSGGFKARGINSIKNTAPERLGNYCDFVINECIQKLPTFLRDTKHALHLIEQKNEIGIPENTNFLVAVIEQMYPRVPWNFFEWVSRFKKNKTWPTIN